MREPSTNMLRKRNILFLALGIIVVAAGLVLAYDRWFRPTRILIVNAPEQQAAAIGLCGESGNVDLTFKSKEEAGRFGSYDAIIMFGRGLFMSESQIGDLEKAAGKGIPVFSQQLRQSALVVNRNLSEEQRQTFQDYIGNGCMANYRNMLLYIKEIATPGKIGSEKAAKPVVLPANMLYHREYGVYFEMPNELDDYLKRKGIYNEGGKRIGLISGINFPAEGNRAHVDTLITMLTDRGFNVYPIAATGEGRERLIKELKPDAIVYLAVGRLGSDSLANWLHGENVPLFVPFPLVETHEEWLDADKPIGGGILTARIVIPEIDGGLYPICIATQNEDENGWLRLCPEGERMEALTMHLTKYMALRDKENREKKIAICYFKKPGNAALTASGLEVEASLYNFLKRLAEEGYDVSGLPETERAFSERLHKDGAVMGSYAKGAQETFMRTANLTWISSSQYEEWASQTLTFEKYKEITDRYGAAPGSLLSRNDSLAIACITYGNIILFPQPRPAIGDDDFKLVHGADVAPPHSYVAPYLFANKGFGADAIIHFGTHGNLEFTPGKNVGLSENDWADALLADLPHFYFYTTGNVGEGIIAKRRTHGNLVTYLTPPYAESGMRRKFASLLDYIHKALDGDKSLGLTIKKEVIRLGLHRDLGLDSIEGSPYSLEELERLDRHAEEIANEKMLGAFYTLGKPYGKADLKATVLAMAADPLAYEMASKDRDKGKITSSQLKDYNYVAHHYLEDAKRRISSLLDNIPEDESKVPEDLRPALRYRNLLLESTKNEMDQMINALNGGNIMPAPGGDPVLNPNVLPTGRNMFSINAETTPSERAWEDGKRLAEQAINQYKEKHGEWPRKIGYTFWAGEFIASEGATIAQALWLMGVEPVRDSQGRVVDIRLVPAKELGRPRVDIMIQVSGQLRDIAASRLKLITEAVKSASEAGDGDDDSYPNFVAEGTLETEAGLVENGVSPKEARELSVLRVFGPIGNGYSTGIMGYTENGGLWEKEEEIASEYINNMGAAYGDDSNWGKAQKHLMTEALKNTDVVVQPRQSNTWGPVSLDHVYEFSGGLSLSVRTITGKEPDSYMADYRNRNGRRLQDTKEAIAVEARSTILNPNFIKERMKGGSGTAEMFGKLFRNIFGWNVMRPSAIDPNLYDDLYDIYIKDSQNLGINEYFRQTNPVALQTITAVMMESARKGYWDASDEQLKTTAELHAALTSENGAACTEFVCGNEKLNDYISSNLEGNQKEDYVNTIKSAINGTSSADGHEVVLRNDGSVDYKETDSATLNIVAIILTVGIVVLIIILIRRRRRK